MQVFGSSGTRGVVGESLTPVFVCEVARAAAAVWSVDRIALARDTRDTGQMLANAAAAGLASIGADVDRLGILPTPGLQTHCDREAIPGVMITASHNPPEYNGVKLIADDGGELSIETLERVEARLLADDTEDAAWDGTGTDRNPPDPRGRYIDAVLTAVDRDRIADADLTVALDPGHGAGALTSPTFFRRLGCRVVTVNAQPDGHFPGRDPEPIPENLDDLGRLVHAEDADVGIAHDGDADRAIFFDEHGDYIEGDATLAALAAAELESGDVTVSAVNVSQRLVDVVDAADADLELTPIGSTHILNRVRERQAAGDRVPIAGEGNGGVIFPEYRLARDGAYTAARFCALIADTSASAVVAPYNGYENVRVDVEYTDDTDRETLLAAAERHATAADATLSTVDGYRLDYGDAWVLARPSGTEPVIRVYAEAADADRAQTLADGFVDAMATARDRR
ncbi:MAG: phosphoglucosamine mutase [Halobacteriaceae archaeon]